MENIDELAKINHDQALLEAHEQALLEEAAKVEELSFKEELNLKRLKKWLRQGDITSLTKEYEKRTGDKISRPTAYKILNGQRRNWEFLKAAFEKALENYTTIKALSDRLRV